MRVWVWGYGAYVVRALHELMHEDQPLPRLLKTTTCSLGGPRVWGLGFRVEGFGFRVDISGNQNVFAKEPEIQQHDQIITAKGT